MPDLAVDSRFHSKRPSPYLMSYLSEHRAMAGNQHKKPNLICQRYEITHCLGQGASGTVYACRDLLLAGLPVAVKLFPKAVSSDKVACARIERELRASFRLNHDHIVRFYDPIRDYDLFGYSMELVNGGALKTFGRKADKDGILWILEILCQICAGLEAIHREGIVHRDLKPDNILLTKEGLAKIADFGIAREVSRCLGGIRVDLSALRNLASSTITQDSELVGTPYYIAPEYVQQNTCDTRADIYALGLIAYELVAGQGPFSGMSFGELIRFKLHEDPPPPNSLNPECPEALSRAIMTALKRNPAARFQCASAMLQCLQTLAKQMSLPDWTNQAKEEQQIELGRRTSVRFSRRLLRALDYVKFLWRICNPLTPAMQSFSRRRLNIFSPESIFANFALFAVLCGLAVIVMGTPLVFRKRDTDFSTLIRLCYWLGLEKSLHCGPPLDSPLGPRFGHRHEKACHTAIGTSPLSVGRRALSMPDCSFGEGVGLLMSDIEVDLLAASAGGVWRKVASHATLLSVSSGKRRAHSFTLDLSSDDVVRVLEAARQGTLKVVPSVR